MKIKKLAVILLCTVMLTLPVIAEIPVSPALKVIAASHRMVKGVFADSDISFSIDDFDTLLGCRVASVTVTSLPEATEGRLILGTTPVMKGQTVSRNYLDMLTFSPSCNASSEASFGFCAQTPNGEYRTGCTLYISDNENTAPTSAGLDGSLFKLQVMQSLELCGRLRAWDAEGDGISYKISEYPKNGELLLSDASSGAYRYIPNENFTGADSFSYTAVDKFGAESEEITVSVEVKKSDSNTFYSDLGSHWAHNAAVKLTDAGVMSGCVKSGMRFFEPEKKMTLSSFTSAAMKAIGYDLDDVVGAETVFWDNNDIPKDDVAYVAEAAKLGYIKGNENENGKLYFNPNKEVSRAEAALILSRMLDGSEPVYRAVFADETSVPTEARDAIYTMNSLGIMDGTGNGNISADASLNRAEAAVMLDKMISVCGIE